MQVVEPGSVFAGYRVLAPLGRGGMGEVWLVEHPTLGRREALKIISAEPTDPTFHERFRNEARTAASLDHPGIVTVYTYGVENGSPWFSMSYVEGQDLTGLAPMRVDDVLTIVSRAAEALDYAHSRRVIHRDVKPANILIARDRTGEITRVTVCDFGIARLTDSTKLTATNLFIGTLAYAAPEVLTGESAIPASDQYALACTTFELLTGAQPFPGETPMALIAGHVNAPAPRISDHRPELAALDPVFARALAKQPASRYESCSAFAAALARAASVPRPAPRPPTAPLPPGPFPYPPTQRPPIQQPPQYAAPYQHHAVGQPPPGSMPPGSAPPGLPPGSVPPGPPSGSRSRTGVIVGAVVGVLVLIGAIVGTTVALTSSGADTPQPDVASGSSSTSSSSAPPAPGDVESVATDGSTSCAVRGRSLYCWGDNEDGTVGDGTSTNRPRPVRVDGLDDVTAVSLGGLGTACAISAGDLYCWGYGIGSSDGGQRTPAKVAGISDVSSVSVGLTICAVSDGAAYCWGNNARGQVGAGTAGRVDTPTRVPGLSGVTAVSTSHTTSCAIASGDAYCWGNNNDDGQIGDGTTTARPAPTRVAGLVAPQSISASLYSTCAVDGSGALYCWGKNDLSGPSVGGSGDKRLTPARVSVSGATQVSTAAYGGCALAGGSVYCWGSRSSSNDRSPGRISGVSGAATVSTGGATVCAGTTGTVYCWGLNSDGQLGNGTTTTSDDPQQVRFLD